MSAVVIFVWAVFNWPNSKGTILCADGNVSRRHKFTCDVRTPNISGSFTLQKAGEFDSAHGDILEGPFYRSSAKKGQFNNAAEWASEGPRVLFSASRSSNLYGNSSTVQPSTIRTMLCIKS